MTTPAATTTPDRSFRLAPLVPLVLPLLCLLWAYWPTLVELAATWSHNPQYQHGFLVPVFAAFLLYQRRDKLDAAALRPSLWGLLPLAVGLGLRLIGGYRYYNSLDSISLVPCIAGLVLLIGGWAAWRWAWPAVLFLGFMIPLPYRYAVAMSGTLQWIATLSSTFILQTLGLPALAEGNVILLNENQIGIVEACSGLRMLVVFFALAAAVVMVTTRPWLDKLVILASAIPIALLSNILRVTATGLMYEMGYSEMANHFFHDVAGYFMMPLALGMLWIEVKLLAALVIEAPARQARTPFTPARRSPVRQRPAVARKREPQTNRETIEAPVPVEQTVQNR